MIEDSHVFLKIWLEQSNLNLGPTDNHSNCMMFGPVRSNPMLSREVTHEVCILRRYTRETPMQPVKYNHFEIENTPLTLLMLPFNIYPKEQHINKMLLIFSHDLKSLQ